MIDTNIITNIETNALLNEFKEKGYFSEYLPSNFNLTCDGLEIFKQSASINDYVEPYHYTMSRFTDNGQRRIISIPDLASYVALIQFLTQQHKEDFNKSILKEILELSYCDEFSFSKIINEKKEIVHFDDRYGAGKQELVQFVEIQNADTHEENIKNSSNYINNYIRKLDVARGAKGVLHIDIGNFYGSIYTHIFPTIKLGFDDTMGIYKKVITDNSKVEIYNKYSELDIKFRGLNGGRTNGIIVGPFISKVIAEVILAKIDVEILQENIRFTRYVDDYDIYIFDNAEIDTTIYKLESIFKKYYFIINNEKTNFEPYPYYLFNNFQKILSSKNNELSSIDIVEIFNEFLKLESEGNKGAVRYLLKSYSPLFTISNKELFSTYLLNILSNDNKSLNVVCKTIIEEFRKGNIIIDNNFISIINNLLINSIKQKKDLEVIWLIYLIKHIGNSISQEILVEVLNSSNDLAIILLIHEFRDLISEDILLERWDKANSWILQYELCLLFPEKKEDFFNKVGINKNKDFYNKLLNKDFSFYKV